MAVGGRASRSTWAPLRRSALITLALGTALLTSGCSVSINGVAGVGVDANGQIIGYLKVCHAKAESTHLWTDGENRATGEWRPDSPVTDYATWSLDGTSAGWSTPVTQPELTPGVEYWLEGYMSSFFEGSTRTVGIRFTLDDLRGLRPGEVLSSVTGFHERPRKTRVTTVDEFRLTACSVLDGDADVSPTPSASS